MAPYIGEHPNTKTLQQNVRAPVPLKERSANVSGPRMQTLPLNQRQFHLNNIL
jgi:hypothetical protein